MITPFDREFKATKRIKQGKKKLKSPFDELAQWISSTRRVNVLNVIYDRANSMHNPRLQVILEHKSELFRFQKGYLGNFIAKEQKSIAKKFIEIIDRDGIQGFDLDGLFVVFSAFAPIAREDADQQVSDREIKELKLKIENPDLWEISRCFGKVTFFFYTDDQVKLYEQRGMKELYAQRYFELLKPHDEFGYLSLGSYQVFFDSKENFDNNYEGSWFYYYR